MLAVHFVEHHFDRFPLTNFVKTRLRVVVHLARGSLVADEREELAKESSADSAHWSVISGGRTVWCGSHARANGFFGEADARIGHDGERCVTKDRAHGGSFNHDL